MSELHQRDAQAQQRPTASAEKEFVFVPATKPQAKARLALAGPAGSGKTYTALKIATGLAAADPVAASAPGAAIGVLDTEHESARKYAGLFPFTTLRTPLTNYDPRRLVRALAAAGAAGIRVLVIDTLSAFWTGQGGMLEQVDTAGRRSYGGNNSGGWKAAVPMERAMIEALLAFPGHVIVTMRTRTDWVVEENDRGRKVSRKVGGRPIQREGIEYEFDVVGEMDMSNTLTISKSHCPELSGQVIFQPGLEVAQELLAWLQDGEPVPTAAQLREEADRADITRPELRELFRDARRLLLAGAAQVDQQGRTVTLADYIIVRGQQVAAAELAAAEAAPAAPGPQERHHEDLPPAPATETQDPPAVPDPEF